MPKIEKSIAGAPFPTPVALVTTIDKKDNANIITLAWVGVACSEPFMISASIRPGRHSHALLEDTKELVLNLPTAKILKETDYCGTVSGRDTDKFSSSGLTQEKAKFVSPPLIKECPVSLEARVEQQLSLGTHDLFVCKVVASHVEAAFLNEKGKFDFSKIDPFIYLATDYWDLDKKIGSYAFTKKSGLA